MPRPIGTDASAEEIQVEKVWLCGSEGSLRKEERGSVWAHLEQHFEAMNSLGCDFECELVGKSSECVLPGAFRTRPEESRGRARDYAFLST
jgi:hypothetical protein